MTQHNSYFVGAYPFNHKAYPLIFHGVSVSMTSDPAYEAICKAKRQAESANVEGALKILEDYLA